MEKQKQTLAIEAGDFITPKKAITISTISLVIWFVTGLSFKLLSVFFSNIPYEGYALVVSLSLSVLFSIYIVKMLVMKSDLYMKILIGVLNTMLIYTSANGAQATYSFLSPPEKSTKSDTVQKTSLIPFLDARPWIPDKLLQSENEALKNDNVKIIAGYEELSKQNSLLQERINAMKDSIGFSPDGIRKDNILLRDSIAALRNHLMECQKRNEELNMLLKNPQKVSDNTRIKDLQDSLIRLNRLYSSCLKKNDPPSGNVKILLERIRNFNLRQGTWVQKTARKGKPGQFTTTYVRQDPAFLIKQQVNKLMNDSTYYDFLFLTPISIK
jgi:hypothetical protein